MMYREFISLTDHKVVKMILKKFVFLLEQKRCEDEA